MVFEKEWELKKEDIDCLVYISKKNKLSFRKGVGDIRCRQKEAERIVQFLRTTRFIETDMELYVHKMFGGS